MRPFHTAFISLGIALALLGCGPPTTPAADDSIPGLISAAERGNLAELDRLLDSTPSVDVRARCAWTPLMKAAQNGHLDSAERLLMAGARTGLGDKGGYTALMLAASNNHVALVELLLEYGADSNHRETTRGWTALIWAAKRGHLASVKALLDGGADTRFRDKQGNSALDWAQDQGYPEVAAYLQKHASG